MLSPTISSDVSSSASAGKYGPRAKDSNDVIAIAGAHLSGEPRDTPALVRLHHSQEYSDLAHTAFTASTTLEPSELSTAERTV